MNFLKLIKKLITRLSKEPSAPIVEESISEKITMETQIESEPVAQVRDWAIEKIQLLHDADRHHNAQALLAEFDEWINIPEGTEELDYLCLEENGWTDEEELDIR
jgi:hypothetical protein